MNKTTYLNLRRQLNFNFSYLDFFKQIIIDLSFCTLLIAIFNSSVSVINVAIIPLFMFRQFAILHEAVHGLTHPQKKINSFIGIISGTFCLTPFSIWKLAHLKHHYWTGNLQQDPTFTILKNFEKSSSFKKKFIELTWQMGFPSLAALQHFGFWLLGLKNIRSAESALSLTIPVSIYSFIFWNMSLGNLIILTCGVLVYLRFYEDMIIPQHVGLYSDEDPNIHPPSWQQPNVTRSWHMHSAIESHIVLNMNYHTEHHLFPNLPWYKLKEAHYLLKAQNENINMVNFHEWIQQQRSQPFIEVMTPKNQSLKSAS